MKPEIIYITWEEITAKSLIDRLKKFPPDTKLEGYYIDGVCCLVVKESDE